MPGLSTRAHQRWTLDDDERQKRHREAEMRSVRVVTIGIGVVALLAGCPGTSSSAIKVEQIAFDPPFGGLNKETIVITNTGTRRASINGWTIRDAAGHVYEFRRGVWLGPHRQIRLHTGRGSDTRHQKFWGRHQGVWDDDGDRATLKRPNEKVADYCRYSGAGSSVDCLRV